MALRLKIGIAAAISLAVMIVFSRISRPDDLDFVIDPYAIRPWAEEEWTEWTADLRGAARTMTEDEFFGNVVLKPYARSHRPGIGVEAPWHEIPMDDFWEPGAVSPPLELHSLGVYGILTRPFHEVAAIGGAPVFERTVVLLEDYYHPRTAERIQPLVKRDPLSDSPGCVLLDLQFSTGQERIEVANFRFFDEHTHVSIAPEASKQAHGNAVSLAGWLNSFRPSGGLLAIDYQIGDVPVGILPAIKDARIQHGERMLRVLEVNRGELLWAGPTYRKNSLGNANFVLWETSGPPGVNILIGAFPYGPLSGFRFKMVGKSGAELKMLKQSLPGLGYLIRYEAPDEIWHIEVTAAERFARQLVSIPPIPGLPPENDSVTNMLDIKFPPALRPSLFKTTPGGGGTLTKNTVAPMLRYVPPPKLESPSTRDLLRYMRNCVGPNARVSYDPEEFSILIDDPSADGWFAKLREHLPPALGGTRPLGGAPVFDDGSFPLP